MTKPVDMSGEAITQRIHELSQLSRLDDPFRPRVEMTRETITQRIRELSDLSRLCAELGHAGRDAAQPATERP